VIAVVAAGLVLCLNASAAEPPASSWTTYGDDVARAGDAAGSVSTSPTRDFVLPLDGRIVGTGAIDEQSSTLYVADAFGRLHALDLQTGSASSQTSGASSSGAR
jgi:hypothetical protein